MSGMFYLRDLPKYDAIRQRCKRYPEVDPASVGSSLVLLRVASDLLAALEAYLSRNKISQGRFCVLMVLNREPELGVAPSDLARRCGVTRATMTGLLSGLERDQLVTRQSVANDRRMAMVLLTPGGIQYLDNMLPDYYRRTAALMGNLSEDEKMQLDKLLWKVNEGLPAYLNA
jgi:MarR family transcriptional regulator, negative regulator of the multidrug operon emrRAB